MAKKTTRFYTLSFLLIVAPVIFQLLTVTSAIGINYGALGNLKPPQQVVEFIKTTFDSVKILVGGGEWYMEGLQEELRNKWCVPKQETSNAQMQANIDWVCKTQGISCKAIFPGPEGYCNRETLKTKASYVMSAYFMSWGLTEQACNTFNGSAIVTTANPSTYTCFISAIPATITL